MAPVRRCTPRAPWLLALGSIAALPGAVRASAQSAAAVVVELEPNGTKAEAQVIDCLAPGDGIEGLTTGANGAGGDLGLDSADTFRVRICALTPGIWRHELRLTTPGPDQHGLTIRGLLVQGPPSSPSIAPGTDTVLQASPVVPGEPRRVRWYGFGRTEELYVRVTGTPATILPYRLELHSTPVAPIDLPSALRTGPIEITTVGQGHTTDTEVLVFDSALVPIAGFRNDDEPGGATNGSRLTRTFAPGVHHLAIGRFNVADAALTGADDAYQLAPVLDFPDLVLSWSASGGTNVSFAVTDAQGTIAVPAALAPVPFELAWYRFVVTDPPQPVVAACFGDGTGTPCPCGNAGGAGRGCANSVQPAGGWLVSNGSASVSADDLVLVGSGMPVSSALYFQGTTLAAGGNGTTFGDGLRCASGAVLRLGTKTNFGGTSQYPGAGDAPVSVRGLVPPTGGSRTYQVWYRNSDPTFCTSAFFNLTNALVATWIP